MPLFFRYFFLNFYFYRFFFFFRSNSIEIECNVVWHADIYSWFTQVDRKRKKKYTRRNEILFQSTFLQNPSRHFRLTQSFKCYTYCEGAWYPILTWTLSTSYNKIKKNTHTKEWIEQKRKKKNERYEQRHLQNCMALNRQMMKIGIDKNRCIAVLCQQTIIQ